MLAVFVVGLSSCGVRTCATYSKNTKKEVKEVKVDRERV